MAKSLAKKARSAFLYQSLYRCRVVPIFVYIILPVLAVRMSLVAVAPDATALWETFFVGDIRSWWKAVFVVGTALWMALHCVIFLVGGWRPSSGLFMITIPLAGLAVLISAVISEYPYTTWIGYTAQYEGAAVLLAYLVGMWYTAQTVDTPRWLYRIIGFTESVNAAIGIAKGMGWDFWLTDAGRWVIGAGEGNIKSLFADSRLASGTVFQPNHFGMFMVVITMVSLGMLFYETRKGWLTYWAVNSLAACLSVIFSHSRAAVIILFFLLLTFAVVFTAGKIRGGRIQSGLPSRFAGRTIWLFAAVVLVVVVVLVAASSSVRGAFRQMIGRSTVNIDAGQSDLVAVDLHDGALYFDTIDSAYSLERNRNGQWVAFRRHDANVPHGAPLDRSSGYWSAVPVSSIKRLSLEERSGETLLRYDDIVLRLVDMGGEVRIVDTQNRVLKTARPAAFVDWPFSGHLLTGRVYIWSRALPLFWNHPWFGSGPGTFALVFPTTDLVGKQRYIANFNEDKGHGIWIHYLVELGLVGWLAWLALLVTVAVVAWRRRGREILPAAMGAAGYLAASLSNDSTVGVTPVFIVLCGIILAADRRSRSDDNAAVKELAKSSVGTPKKHRK
ncbi:MAG: O-antigen ligase family protein [Planctomycetes bacterium]|nr:O-antigen ligase family protein [Planctomycetota bacterium]